MDDIKCEEDLIQRQKKEKKDLTGTLNIFFFFLCKYWWAIFCKKVIYLISTSLKKSQIWKITCNVKLNILKIDSLQMQ